MKRFDTDVGSLQSALEERPKVFHSVGVDLPIHVPLRMVNHLMLEFLIQPDIRHKRIGIDRAARLNVLINLALKHVLASSGNDTSPNFAIPFEDADNRSL